MQTLRKKTSPCKYRNDPGRFFGDGVQFKAKLIGILEVGEARGDRMCQEALQDLKMAIRAAGEHKQRITIHVTIDGLRLRDEKTGDSLYHHPVHKISFIAQDMTDSRAFGYIFGSPDSGHRFFGIKTDKAASQVVLAMRDLFQVVFELKKKEIELARQQIQSKSIHEHQLSSLKATAGVHNDLSGGSGSLSLGSMGAHCSSSGMSRLGVNVDGKGASKELSPESVADLVDLEQELSSLQRGITQMERITPSESAQQPPVSSGSIVVSGGKVRNEDDPFGDSFTHFKTYNLLPPPESGRSRNKPNSKTNESNVSGITQQNLVGVGIATMISPAGLISNSPVTLQPDDEDSWLNDLDQQNDVFDTSKTSVVMGMSVGLPIAPLAPSESTSTPTQQLSETSILADVEQPVMATIVAATAGVVVSNVSDLGATLEPPQSAAKAVVNSDSAVPAADPVMLPRDTDPFSPTRKKSDPFQDGDIFAQLDPFEFEFSSPTSITTNTTKNSEIVTQRVSPTAPAIIASETRRSADVFNGPLQVQLPPESGISPPPALWKGDISRLERQSNVSPILNNTSSSIRSRPTPSAHSMSASASSVTASALGPSSVFKQQTVDVISSISNKKMPHLFGQARFSKRSGDSNSINMRRLQESDSLSENEAAPEPPPRPDPVSHAEPPPLPPKKQFNDIVIRPRVSSASNLSSNRYEFINSTIKTARNTSAVGGGDVPPIPLPSRRVGRSDGTYPGPGRPRKPGHTEDDYLAPISGGNSSHPEVPPLLPPPTQSSARARPQRQNTLHSKVSELYENKSEILKHQTNHESVTMSAASASGLPDITLSQLLTLGIDELATKLNVPMSKLSTMTLVELTSYLAEFIESSKPAPTRAQSTSPSCLNEPPSQQPPVFKVNFNQSQPATFVAKFDDTFGEDITQALQTKDTFVANFAQFNEAPVAVPPKIGTCTPAVPPADRYAVFREIIDQELQHQQHDLMGDLTPPDSTECNVTLKKEPTHGRSNVSMDEGSGFEAHFDDEEDEYMAEPPSQKPPPPPPPPAVHKIDTKITEVVAQAKDRYAALRDIILVENLFENKPPVQPTNEKDLLQDFPDFSDDFNEDQDLNKMMDDPASSTERPDRVGLVDSCGFPGEPSSSALTVEDDDEEDDDRNGGAESSLDSNEKDADVAAGTLPLDKYEKLSTSTQHLDVEKAEAESEFNSHAKQDCKFLTVGVPSSLSASKDDLEIDELMQRAISNLSLDSREHISPANSTNTGTARIVTNNTLSTNAHISQFSDVSTSPIQLPKSPLPLTQLNSPLPKSRQASPLLTQLSAVSNLIDTATKQMSAGDLLATDISSMAAPPSKLTNESWATFDSPKSAAVSTTTSADASDKRRTRISSAKAGKLNTTLHLPPPPPSNTSQNDTADSPCSSDPRDEGVAWSKTGGSSSRRWSKKERHQTSSSSRDLSPWDDEAPDYLKQKRMPTLPPTQSGLSHPHALLPDRHGYYMRHARRMNSCDEDYDYEEEFNNRREHRKFKQGISRSRDNFDLDSPSWYHHPPHHTWSPQDIEQQAAARARSFERSAYDRTTYGPPIYDKRGIALPPGSVAPLTYEQRRSGYDKSRKYYRDYARPNYDFDAYAESPPPPSMQERYREAGSFEKRRSDYENVYDDVRGYKIRGGVTYERKSFDRESVESFESATRRRRSFGSGDVYGSLESREDFRDRYMGGSNMGPDKTRSLRKSMKLRATGDIDYEQDSENDFHSRPRGVATLDSRSLQRPSQLAAITGAGNICMIAAQTRMRKSSGSSPWDGEEPPLPGQKSWKRPSSAAESERRLAESRRAATLGQTPSGSDGEKDRRLRKKQRPRGKELATNSSVAVAPNAVCSAGGRYSHQQAAHARDNYDYITYDDDDNEDYVDEEESPPTDEDKFERLNRRRHEMHQRMLESERRQPASTYKSATAATVAKKNYTSGRAGGDYDFDDYEQSPTPRSIVSGSSVQPISNTADSKFSFDGGFESDFNQSQSPPPVPAGTASSISTPAATLSANTTPAPTATTKSSFRFSNDFSGEREKLQAFSQTSNSVSSSLQQFELEVPTATSPAAHATPPITQKLRFDDNVKISQFDDSAAAAFEDDFSKAKFDFEKENQWHADSLAPTAVTTAKKQNLRNSKLQQRQELIKKSESINIFAKKAEDPFEDDEFFSAPSAETKTADNDTTNVESNNFQWDDDNNFAKFDENM